MKNLKFKISDEVKILPLEDKLGTIINIWMDINSVQYKVIYFINEEPKEIYFYEKELSNEIKQQQKQIGFK